MLSYKHGNSHYKDNSFILTHWRWVTHICVSKVTIIVSNNGLSPGRRQAIIWNNAGILLIGPLGTNFTGILIEIHTFSFKKMHLKMSSGKWRPFCLGLNVLMRIPVLVRCCLYVESAPESSLSRTNLSIWWYHYANDQTSSFGKSNFRAPLGSWLAITVANRRPFQ